MITIVIADDSFVTQRVLGTTLRRAGYRILTADDGQQAWDLLHTEAVDLLIADIDMPEIDGIALLRQIRADTQLAPLPVVMLTASGAEFEHKAAVSAGANALLTKPASSTELLDAVQSMVGGL